jgi:hypothetical protein
MIGRRTFLGLLSGAFAALGLGPRSTQVTTYETFVRPPQNDLNAWRLAEGMKVTWTDNGEGSAGYYGRLSNGHYGFIETWVGPATRRRRQTALKARIRQRLAASRVLPLPD